MCEKTYNYLPLYPLYSLLLYRYFVAQEVGNRGAEQENGLVHEGERWVSAAGVACGSAISIVEFPIQTIFTVKVLQSVL